MKQLLGLVLLQFISVNLLAQHIQEVEAIVPDKPYDNIWLYNISNDSLTSSFVIYVKDSVMAHKHAFHSEQIYVLQGKAKMYLNDEVKMIKKGDVILVPKNTWHAVKVQSKKPLKVLSIQSPYFDGKDRILKGK